MLILQTCKKVHSFDLDTITVRTNKIWITRVKGRSKDVVNGFKSKFKQNLHFLGYIFISNNGK